MPISCIGNATACGNQSVLENLGQHFGTVATNIVGIDPNSGAPILLGILTVAFFATVCFYVGLSAEATGVVLVAVIIYVTYLGWLPVWVGILVLIACAVIVATAFKRAIFES